MSDKIQMILKSFCKHLTGTRNVAVILNWGLLKYLIDSELCQELKLKRRQVNAMFIVFF